jgi:hypothetical protein
MQPSSPEDPDVTAMNVGQNETAPLIYERRSGTSRTKLYVEPTAAAISEAEAAGWVAPDPATFRRRCAIVDRDLFICGQSVWRGGGRR